MEYAVNLDDKILTELVDFESSVSQITLRRGDVLDVSISLVRDNAVVELASPTISVFVTDSGDYTSLLTSATGFTQENTGTDTIYEASLSLDQAAITALFPDGTTAKASAVLEVRVVHDGETITTEPVPLTIQNTYIAP